MRILMITGVQGRAEAGAAGIVYNLTKGLTDLGHVVKPMFSDDLLAKQKWPNRFRTVELARSAAHYVDQHHGEYDIVNIHAPFGFWYGARRKRLGSQAGPPYVMTMHGLEERRMYAMAREAKKGRADYYRRKNRIWQNLYHMPTYRRSLITADQSIVTNRETLLYAQLHYNLPPDRVWFIPNGVGPEFLQPRTFSTGRAAKLLFVGTWIDHKGIYYLAEAFERVLSAFPETRLTVAGCIVPEEQVRRSFASATQGALTVLPFVSRADIARLYADNEVFVLPSLMEGMPLVLLEAMASGLPVITTESCGMTDLVEDSLDGLLVVPGDTNSLVSAILRFCQDGDLRRRLGCAAQEKMKRFTWQRTAHLTEMVFQRALGLPTL